MILTNKHGLPAEIYEYLAQDFYDHENAKDTISATTFLKPIQAAVMMKRHFDTIEVDAVDQMWSLFGSGVHAVLERIKSGEPVVRMKAQLEGETVSGKYDRVVDNTIKDYKCTKSWSIAFKKSRGDFTDWKMQLSIYRWLYLKNYNVTLNDKGDIIAILRDWDEEYAGYRNYPATPAVVISLPLLGVDQTEEFLVGKIRAIRAASALPDVSLPKCTVEDRWWNEKKKKFLNCEKYCPVRSICPQHSGADIFGAPGVTDGRGNQGGEVQSDWVGDSERKQL